MAFPCGWSNGVAGNRHKNAVAAWAPRPARGFRMELNPNGVKDRQFFRAKSFFAPSLFITPLLRRTLAGRTADLGDRPVPPARRDPHASRELWSEADTAGKPLDRDPGAF